MGRAKCLLLFLSFGLFSASAAFSKEDISGSYAHKHMASAYNPEKDEWSAYEISDKLVLQQNNEGGLHFCFELYFTNGHQCVMEADARRVGQNRYEYLARDPDSHAVECQLNIHVAADMIRLADVDARCRELYCGARGIIDGSEFDRTLKSKEELNCGFKY